MTDKNPFTMALPYQQQQSNAGDPMFNQDGTITVPVEQTPPPPQQANPDRRFTADDIERARQQEKDKLYPRLSAFEQQLAEMKAEREQERQRFIDAEKAKADAEELARRAEMDAKQLVETLQKDMEAKLAEQAAELQKTQAIMEMERRFAEVNAYRIQRTEEERAADTIIPELLPLIQGDTIEDIDNAIAVLRDRSDAIVASVQATQQQFQPPAPQPVGRGTSVSAPPVGPMENQTEYQTLSASDIANMDMKTWAEMRKRVLPPNARSSQGIFGGGRY